MSTFRVRKEVIGYPTARSEVEGSRLAPSSFRASQTEPNLFGRRISYCQKDIINIFTDGSKTEHGIGAAFYILNNEIWAYQWSAKLNDNNTIFQTELAALHETVIYAKP
ncbi:hypothetical protein AVEN_46152-1 [Araneus ventricosus]|uniref:RNase H type-1 domain-containing protein n=1 Tax=Araneus ventricosus TaxID=182803 RepID=A0A4Y2D9A4_ARAVE|nr:hypothetical protein AVEN_46152-1 [Araneus ventricosus]